MNYQPSLTAADKVSLDSFSNEDFHQIAADLTEALTIPSPGTYMPDIHPPLGRAERRDRDAAARSRRQALKAAKETHERKLVTEARAARKHRKLVKRHRKANVVH